MEFANADTTRNATALPAPAQVSEDRPIAVSTPTRLGAPVAAAKSFGLFEIETFTPAMQMDAPACWRVICWATATPNTQTDLNVIQPN